MIDKRSLVVGSYLAKYFTDAEVLQYEHISSDKVSLIIELKELEDRLHLSQKAFADIKAPPLSTTL